MTDSALQMGKTKKYDIPISKLDYSYVSECENVKELEKIIKILRSGDEGYFPDLEKTAVAKLEKLNPKSHVLREESPVINPTDLPKEEWSQIDQDLKDWTSSMKIRVADGAGDTTASSLPPVRKGQMKTTDEQASNESQKSKNNKSVKPRSYEEWDKIDIDEELESVDKREEEEQKEREKKAQLQSNRKEFEMSTTIDTEGLSEEEIFLRANREKDKGNEALKCGDIDESILYYTRSLSLIPTPVVYNNRALAYVKLSKWQQAISDCDEVLMKEKHNVKALLRQSAAYIGLKDAVAAEQSLQIVLSIDNNNKKAQDMMKECTEICEKKNREKDQRKEKGRRMVIEEVDGMDNEPTHFSGTSKNSKSDNVIETKTRIEEIPVYKQNGMHEDPKKIKNTKMKTETLPKTELLEEPKKVEKDIWSLDEIENCVNVNTNVDLQAMSMGIVNTETLPEKPQRYQNNYSEFDEEDEAEEIEVEKPSSGLKITEITEEFPEEKPKSSQQITTSSPPPKSDEEESDEEEISEESVEKYSAHSESREVTPESQELAATQEKCMTEGACSNRSVFKQEKLPRNLLSVKEEGSSLFRTGQYGKAILRYTNLIDELEKDSVNQSVNLSLMYSNRAACYLKTGHSKAAMTDCQRSLDIIPHAIKPLLRRAAACEHLEKYQQAYVDYRHILSIDRSVQLALSGSSRCQNILQQLDGAMWRDKLPPLVTAASWEVPEILLDNSETSSSQNTESRPPPEDLPNPDLEFEESKKLGNGYVQKGEFQQAVECYSRCIELNPDNAVGYTNRALCYLKLNEPEKAVVDCNGALKLDISNDKALYRRALARKMLHQYKDSLQDLTEVLKLDPKNSAAQKEFDIVRNVYKEELKHIKESTPPVEPINTKKKAKRMKIEEVEEEEEESSKESVQNKADLKTSQKVPKPSKKDDPALSPRSDSRQSSEGPPDQTKPNKSRKLNKNKQHKDKNTEESQSYRKTSVSSKEDEMLKMKEDLDWLEPKQPEAPLSKSAKRRMKAKAKKSGAEAPLEGDVPEAQPEDKSSNTDASKLVKKDKGVLESQKSDSKTINKKSTQFAELSQEESAKSSEKIIKNNSVSKSDTKTSRKAPKTLDIPSDPVESVAQSKTAKKKKERASSKEGTPVIGLPVPTSSEINKMNATPYEFMTAWNSLKSLKDTDCYTNILRQFPPQELPKIISNKLDGTMLTKILQCVNKDMVSEGENVLGYQILKHVSSVERFSMISMMLSSDEKKELSDVFIQLKKSNHTEYSERDVDSLQKAYNIK